MNFQRLTHICILCMWTELLRRHKQIHIKAPKNNWGKCFPFPGSRTTPHEDNSPPDKNKAHPLPTRTTIPRTIPHQDNSPLGPLPRNKTTHQDQNLYGGELSSWGVVRIRLFPCRSLSKGNCDNHYTLAAVTHHRNYSIQSANI